MSGDSVNVESDDSVWVHTDGCLAAVAQIRQGTTGAANEVNLIVPEVGVASATESLGAVAGLAGSLAIVIAEQLEQVAKAITLGAMDAYRADNPDIDWSGTESDS